MCADHTPTDQQQFETAEGNHSHGHGRELLSSEECKAISLAVCNLSLSDAPMESNAAALKLRAKTETAVERFYFTGGPPGVPLEHYIDCLVALNPHLMIDDLIYSNLRYPSDERVLEWIHRLVKRRSFSRTTLKHILNSIVYVDTEGSDRCTLLKYRILAQIVKQYSIGDHMISSRNIALEGDSSAQLAPERDSPAQLASERDSSTQLKDNNQTTAPDIGRYKIIEAYLGSNDLGKDNANVLANIVWESTILLLENLTYTTAYEVECILEMFTVIIASTGKFFQNRISKRVEMFKSLDGSKAFKPFVDAISSSFDNSDLIVGRLADDRENEGKSVPKGDVESS